MMKVKLKDVASFSKGQQINGDDLLPSANYAYLNGGISPSGYWNEYNIPANSIAISEGGNSCGYVNYMQSPFWCGAHCYYLFDLKISNTKYLYYALKARQDDIMKLRSGACMPNIKKSDLGEFAFEFDFDDDHQTIVVDQLERVERMIALRKQQLSKLDELVKSRFIEMFGDPNSNPMHWNKVELAECLINIENGKSFVCDSEPRIGEKPAVLKLSAATYGYYQPHENKAMLDDTLFVESAEVHIGDLLFTRKNTPELVGMCAYVYDTPSKLMMPDLIFRLNTRENCDKVFLWKIINLDLFRSNITALSSGSAKSMSNISKERLLGLEIILPPIALQQQFAAFVEQIDKSKFEIQKSLEKLETLKKALMQKYFG